MSLSKLSFIALAMALTFSEMSFPVAHCHNLSEPSCPLDFGILVKLFNEASKRPSFTDIDTKCRRILDGIRLVRAEYLRINGFFQPPLTSHEECWDSYQKTIGAYVHHDFDITTSCGYHPEWIFVGCMNITSRTQFESLIPSTKLKAIGRSCNQSLDNRFACKKCTDTLSSHAELYLRDTGTLNTSDCSGYLHMYTAAFFNRFGPTDRETAKCLFSLEVSKRPSSTKHHRSVLLGVALGCTVGLLGASFAVCFLWLWHKKQKQEKGKSATEKNDPLEEMNDFAKDEASLVFAFGLYSRSPSLVQFRIEEIKKATMNFSRENIIGMGGYGNVYKGILQDGSKVAMKRFKNCTAVGDTTFVHEVEVIASVRHVNLVALRGFCTATVPLEGHHRIIVCDLMSNGSLYDHLFGAGKEKLSWPVRKKIALGTARGLAYLHYSLHPAIIHRDIKAGNILLDETFEPKVADFGLAKINSEGMTHLSTRAAGTLGYVAPEYALYGKLTERSDVYSFGVVLLELLSGRKAYENNEGKISLLADWAWALVQEGKTLDVIEEDMPEVALTEEMEQYVMIAALCSHPILQARPTMDQIVKILETGFQVSSIVGAYISPQISETFVQHV